MSSNEYAPKSTESIQLYEVYSKETVVWRDRIVKSHRIWSWGDSPERVGTHCITL